MDTVLCCNVLEHIEDDEAVLGRSYRLLTPGGHCVVVAPAGPWLYTSIDEGASRCRRYAIDALREKMSNAGFDIVHARRFGRLGALGWAVSGHLLKRREFESAPKGLVRPPLPARPADGIRVADARIVADHGGAEASTGSPACGSVKGRSSAALLLAGG